eukprot:2976938-Lingulodinium_polyedra.AAC.1
MESSLVLPSVRWIALYKTKPRLHKTRLDEPPLYARQNKTKLEQTRIHETLTHCTLDSTVA